DRHLLRRRALPLRDLGRGRVPRAGRPLLLVAEGDRPAVPRARRPAQLLARLPRDEPDLLPDAQPGTRRDAEARLHLAGGRPLERGELVLDEGHETPGTTLADGFFDEVLEMPAGSAAPVVLALFLCLAAVTALTSHFVLMGCALGLVAVTLAAWHAKEPA